MRKKIISLISLLISDFICVFICFLLAYFVRVKILPHFFTELQQRPLFFEAYFSQFYMYLVWAVVFAYEKLYTKRYVFWEEVRLLFKGTTIAISITMLTIYITQQYLMFSRLVVVLAWIMSLFLFPVFRYVTKLFLIKLDLWVKSVIIIGSTGSSASLIRAVNQNKILGFKIVGCLSDRHQNIGKSIDGVKVLGHIDDINEWKKKTQFEDIIVTLPNIPRNKLIGLLRRWDHISETIRYIPRTGDLISTGIEIENIGNILSLTVRKNLQKPWNIAIKYTFEFFLALILFVVLLPVFLLIGVGIKMDSKGPVFFVQDRFGKDEKSFRCLKFRSMFVDANRHFDKYLEENADAKAEWKKFKKLKTFDPRVTKVGRFLRRYSLDELPQLLNVLKFEMSVVGPRPYIMEELKNFNFNQSILLHARPGITGLWQISGRSHLLFEKRLDLDEYYVRNWSFWLDMSILLKTIKVTLFKKGAF